MARSAAATRTRILDTAYALVYREGFARVSVDAIADAAGVTKRTLYNHFASKDALVGAVLEHQHRYALGQIQAWAPEQAKDPADFLAAIFAELETWAAQPRWLGSGFTRLTMELADRRGHPARAAARQHKAAIEGWLAAELCALEAPEPEDLARQVMLLIEGCLSLVLIHGDTGYVAAAARAAQRLAGGGRAYA